MGSRIGRVPVYISEGSGWHSRLEDVKHATKTKYNFWSLSNDRTLILLAYYRQKFQSVIGMSLTMPLPIKWERNLCLNRPFN